MMGQWFYGPYGGSWLMMGIGMIVHILFWVLIIYVIARLLRGVSLGGRGSHESDFTVYSQNRDSAKDILKQRYAKGEITKDQYKEMLNDIRE